MFACYTLGVPFLLSLRGSLLKFLVTAEWLIVWAEDAQLLAARVEANAQARAAPPVHLVYRMQPLPLPQEAS
jgi:hypothetical protein